MSIKEFKRSVQLQAERAAHGWWEILHLVKPVLFRTKAAQPLLSLEQKDVSEGWKMQGVLPSVSSH